MAVQNGIFVRSDKNAVSIIQGCEELLKGINSDCSCIKSLKATDNPKGFKICFKDASVVAAFLKKKYLPLTGDLASIHALTTKLTVHDIYPDSVKYLKESLSSQLEEWGEILSISHIPIAKEYPSIQSGCWLVEYDIPEVLEMDIFKNSGLPDSMKIQWPSKSNEPPRTKKVTLFCCLCGKKDHPRENCPIVEGASNDQIKNFPESDGESDNSSFASRKFPRFEIRDKSSASTPISKSVKQKHRIEAIASGLERKKTQSQIYAQNFYGQENKVIKQEAEDESQTSSPNISVKHFLQENEGGNNSKKFRFAKILPCQSAKREDKFEDNLTASSTTGRESPEILMILQKSKEAENFETKPFSYQDDSSIPNLPTSSQPENFFENNNNNSAAQKTSDCSNSIKHVRTPKGTRKKPIYASVILPNRIKQIVLERGPKEGELNISQLEAFFSHVKKKTNPAKIAKQFTSDVQCLHEQLKAIVHQYYMTPKVDDCEDSRFMKWLEGMLDRFVCPVNKKEIEIRILN